MTEVVSAVSSGADRGLDVEAIRREFPALHQEVHPGKPLVYLDSAATALKPQSVIDAVVSVYAQDCANIHRAVHALSQRATARYEAAREKVVRFLGAESREEIVFTSGTTDGLNLVAMAFANPAWDRCLGEGDEVLVTELEHHSDIVPWQLLCARTGATLRVVPITPAGEVRLEDFQAKLNEHTKVVAFAHVSNSLGTVLPVKAMAELAHQVGALVVVDGAQGVVHARVDVQDLGADFYAFSGHKIYGPTGIGALYGKRALLEAMPPWRGGGDMIDRVSFAGSTWNDLPYKFEAGTPNIAGVIGMGAAIDYMEGLGLEAIAAHEARLLAYGTKRFAELDGVRLIGTAEHKAGVLAFVMDGIHPTDAGSFLDADGVAIRTGHHCAQPVMDHYGVTGTARASLGVYNTEADLDALIEGLKKVQSIFG
ncbi:MAG: cysteine desulfurase CsdA [Sandaracinus sp.]|nr:cysteine desulfurase CsdA [Sandaracinus sp.]